MWPEFLSKYVPTLNEKTHENLNQGSHFYCRLVTVQLAKKFENITHKATLLVRPIKINGSVLNGSKGKCVHRFRTLTQCLRVKGSAASLKL
jgi:hypothetical protein